MGGQVEGGSRYVSGGGGRCRWVEVGGGWMGRWFVFVVCGGGGEGGEGLSCQLLPACGSSSPTVCRKSLAPPLTRYTGKPWALPPAPPHLTRYAGKLWALTPAPPPHLTRYAGKPWALVLIIVGGSLLLAALFAPLVPILCCAPNRGGRPILMQAILNIRKRTKGPPRGCGVSLVVTDIEGYSGAVEGRG